MESILQIQEKYDVDTSIKSLEYYPFLPITGTQYNSAGQIRINIENQDEFFYPHRSWIEVEGKLVKSANAALYGDAELVTLTNNGILYLFDNIKYSLSGQEIESLNNPGRATTMLGLAKYSTSYNDGPGLSKCWSLDTSTAAADTNVGFKRRREHIIPKPTPNGTFAFGIDMEHVFGFAEDYNKVVYGFRHTLTMVRKASNDDAIFRAAGVDAGKVEITKITWWMPRVQPSDAEKYKLYKSIESKVTLDAAFRMRQCATVDLNAVSSFTWGLGVRSAPEKPRYLIIGLQTNKKNNQEHNAALFDHCRVTNMKARLNGIEYPAVDWDVDFTMQRYPRVYMALMDFARQYYGVDPMVSSIGVNATDFKDLYPIFLFDVSKQSERLNQGVVDISVDMTFKANVDANTAAYAVLISDRKIKFQSDGKKMNVIF